MQSRLDALVTNADLAPLLSLVKGIRNGAVYGAKVRFPHALVYVDKPSRYYLTDSMLIRFLL